MAMEASAEMTMPRAPDAGILGWIRTRLFSGIGSSIMTVIFMVALFVMLPPLVEWAIIKATWVAPDMKVCREAGGACWAWPGTDDVAIATARQAVATERPRAE